MKVIIGNYEGTIYPEGDGFTGAISLGFGPDGKRKRLKRKGKTKTQVKDRLREAIDDLEKGVKAERSYTVKDAMLHLLDHLAKQEKSDATMQVYRGFAEVRIIPKIGHIKLKELTADHVEDWLDECAATMTTQSLNILHGLIKRSIRLAARRGKVGHNVALLVDTPKGKKSTRKSRSLSLEEATLLLQTAQDPKYRIGTYVILAITSGLRTEELRALTWADVDLKKKVVYVLRADRNGGDTKTEKSRRGLSLADMAAVALSALRKRQAAEKLAAGEAWQGHDLVFCKEDGSPYTSSDVLRRFRKITKDAGLGVEWTARELRHTFVSIMSDHGVALEKISDLVGHTDTTTTQKVYRHQLRPVITEGAKRMNVIFKGKITKPA